MSCWTGQNDRVQRGLGEGEALARVYRVRFGSDDVEDVKERKTTHRRRGSRTPAAVFGDIVGHHPARTTRTASCRRRSRGARLTAGCLRPWSGQVADDGPPVYEGRDGPGGASASRAPMSVERYTPSATSVTRVGRASRMRRRRIGRETARTNRSATDRSVGDGQRERSGRNRERRNE